MTPALFIVRLVIFGALCALAAWAIVRRVSSDSWVRRLAALNFSLVLGLGVLLYLLSSVAPAHLLVRPGFWTFARDAHAFDTNARILAAALRDGVPFPDPSALGSSQDPAWVLAMGTLYWAVGDHPLAVVMLNATLASLTVAVLAACAARFGGPRAARFTAGVVALWPAMLLWASQALKDATSLALVAVAVAAVAHLIGEARPWRWRDERAAVLGLGLSMFLLMLLRSYLAVGLAASMALVAVAMLFVAGNERWAMAGRAAIVAVALGTVGVSVWWTAPAVWAYRALSPHDATVARFEAGRAHQDAGRIDGAIREYQAVVTANDRFWPAWYNLAFPALQQGDMVTARDALRRFLEVMPWTPSPNGSVCPRLPCTLEQVDRAVRTLAPGRHRTPFSREARPTVQAMINWIEDALALPSAERAAASRRLAEQRGVILSYRYGTVRQRAIANNRVPTIDVWGHPSPSDAGETIAQRSLLQAVADLRRGSIHQHGGLAAWEQPDETFLLIDEVPDNPGWLTVASWVPQGVAAVLFSPYPWEWLRTEGREASRVLAGLESVVVALLLPLAVVGGVAAWRSGHPLRPSCLFLCMLFLVFSAGLGMTMLNAGSLFRLRISALLPLFVLEGVGWAWWRQERT